MGSHSVTCHPTEVRIPPLPPAEAGTRFSDPGGMQGWVDLCEVKATGRELNLRPVNRKYNALPLSHVCARVCMTHSRCSWDVLGVCSYRVSQHGRVHASLHIAWPGCSWPSPRWRCSKFHLCVIHGGTAPETSHSSSASATPSPPRESSDWQQSLTSNICYANSVMPVPRNHKNWRYVCTTLTKENVYHQHDNSKVSVNVWISVHGCQCRIKGVLGVLQHPGPQFWGPAIGGSGKLVTGL